MSEQYEEMTFDCCTCDGEHSRYVLKVDNYDEIIMTSDPSDTNWAPKARGTEIMRLQDTGNDVKIILNENVDIHLDYNQTIEILMLLKYYYEHSGINGDTPVINKLVSVA